MNKVNYDILNQIPYTEEGRLSALIIQGRPGIGKTHIANSIIRNNHVRIPMATKTPESFGAYPLPVRDVVMVSLRNERGELALDENNNEQQVEKEVFRVEQALSESVVEPLLERNIGDDFGVLIFDDVTLGDPQLQSAILEIVQFGVIANEKLGRNVLIILTGNGTSDGSYAVEWSKALLGRALLIDFEPDFDYWLNLDSNQDVDPVVVGFLKDFPDFFAPEVDCEKTTDESGKTPSPRDHTRLGLALTKLGGYKAFSPNFLFKSVLQYASSFIGKKAGAAFKQYADNFNVYPTAEELFQDAATWESVPAEKKQMLSGCIAVVFALRNYGVKQLELNLDNPEKCFQIVTTMLNRTRLIAEHNREVVAYMLSYFLTWATDSEFEKERQNVVLSTCDVLTSDEYKEDKDFNNFVDALWRVRQQISK